MDHPSSKSPDPADCAFEVGTAEESQQSITLQNALERLPDTQETSQGSQQVSPEGNTICAAPLILRPTQPDADDLSVGFSYDKPSVVKPGQFSGRKQPIPIVKPSADGSFLPNAPHIDQAADIRGAANVKANPSMPTHLSPPRDESTTQEPPRTRVDQNSNLPVHSHQAAHIMKDDQRPRIEGHMRTTASLPRQKHPFTDHQPSYRALEPHKQNPTTGNSLQDSIEDEHRGSFPKNNLIVTKAADVQQDLQCHPVKSSTINATQRKPRTSFQNDISVSSARPPRSMPGSSPRATLIHRPTRANSRHTSRLSTPAARSRSSGSVCRSSHSIIKSNSKAKRTSRTAHISSSSLSPSCNTNRGEETPSMKQRPKGTPAEALQDLFHQKLVTTAADLANCLNDKFADIGAEVDQHLQTFSDLKKGMNKQRNDLSRYKECILGKDNKIQQLEQHCENLVAQLDITRQELDARSSKVSRLEEKCRSYRTFLNNAITEQQELYKATKAKCDGAITKIHEEERKRLVLQEQERKKVEDTRDKMNQLVQLTVNEYRQKEREFHNQIKDLNQRVQERDADVARERETAQALIVQNGSIDNIHNTLKTLGQQIEHVATKVNEVAAQQSQPDGRPAKEVNIKLDQIVQFLRILDEQTPSTAQLSKEMRELNEKTVASISEKLEPINAAQVHAKTSLDALTSGVEACMNDVWEELDERQTMLETLYLKQEAGREERVGALQRDMKELEKDLAHQDQLLLQSEQDLQQREATIAKLQLDIADLAKNKEQTLAELNQMDQLREDYAKMTEEAACRASLASDLENKLQETTTQLVREEQDHQKHIEELQRLMEQQVADAIAAQVEAVEAAQQDAMVKMNETKAGIDARLAQALKERATLQNELDEAKLKMIEMEAESSRISGTATDLKKELQSSRAEVAKGKQTANLKDAEQQTAIDQQLKLIHELRTKLANAEGSFNTLCNNTKSYDRAAQTILRSMQDWTKNYATIIANFRDLKKNVNKDAILKDINSKLRPLVELQLLQTAVSEYCQTQKEAAQLLSEDSATAKTATSVLPSLGSVSMAAGRLVDRMRRVTVMSPASNASSPQPPSVRIEQERRRIEEQPKSILKLVPQIQHDGEDDARREEDARRELLSNTSINRGLYNRPVAGRKSQTGQLVASLSQRTPSTLSGSDGAVARGAGNAPGIKRKQSSEQEPGTAEGRSVKRKALANSMVGFSSPPEYAKNQPDLDPVPCAPRKAGWKDMVEEEQPSSPPPSQSSQEQSQRQSAIIRSQKKNGGSILTRGRPFKGNDPLSMFFEHPYKDGGIREKAESQESFMHSQDIGNERDFRNSSRFSFGP
ncbi:hypothetical protein N0V93_002911 [Gnomoniopsis smithogilvyi]|uniref:Uncharacterized protein n=1 Tax=Gnomoniopsis smithogilvyi TaxID=1191159 RepID=A0A9W8YXG6_9PEZI|nr:hypothetical protein N0V93_002911 [Gnomoniopsis smithogilvyi]